MVLMQGAQHPAKALFGIATFLETCTSEVGAPGWRWQLLPHTKAGHCWVHAAAPSLSPLPSPASPPTTQGLYLGFCSVLFAAFALAKQGGVFSFPYDRLVGINKTDKSKKVTGMAVNKLF